MWFVMMDRTFATVILIFALIAIPIMLFLSAMIEMLWYFGVFLVFDISLIWICVRGLKNSRK